VRSSSGVPRGSSSWRLTKLRASGIAATSWRSSPAGTNFHPEKMLSSNPFSSSIEMRTER